MQAARYYYGAAASLFTAAAWDGGGLTAALFVAGICTLVYAVATGVASLD